MFRAENLKRHRNPVIHTISYLIFTLAACLFPKHSWLGGRKCIDHPVKSDIALEECGQIQGHHTWAWLGQGDMGDCLFLQGSQFTFGILQGWPTICIFIYPKVQSDIALEECGQIQGQHTWALGVPD